MKRVLLIILISFLGRDLIGQAVTKRAGASVTVNDENLFTGKSFKVPVYTDTTAANLAVTLDSCGKIIYTYDVDGYWGRGCYPKKWVRLGSGSGGASWDLTGNTGTTSANFLGPTDRDTFDIKVNGVNAGHWNIYPSTGGGNLLMGSSFSKEGTNNSIYGMNSFRENVDGIYNTSGGAGNLYYHKHGDNNTAFGQEAMSNDTTANDITAIGTFSVYSLIDGNKITALGYRSAFNETRSNKLYLGHQRTFGDGDLGTDTTGIPIYVNYDDNNGYWNQNLIVKDSLKVLGFDIGVDSDSAWTKGADGRFEYSKINSGGGGTPAGSDAEVQFNNSGAFGASANLTWNGLRLSTIAATIGSTSTPDATSPLTIDAASTNTAYLLQMGKNGNPAYFRIDKDGNITDIGGGAAPISSSGGKPNFTNGFASISWASNSEGNAVLSTLSGSTVPWVLNTSSSTTDNMVSFRVMGNNATTKGDIQQWTDNSSNILSVVNKDGKFGVGVSSPTAYLHPKAGTATAGTAPIKLNTGTALTTPEDGAIEYHGSHIYFTIGSTRYQLDQQTGTNIYNSDGSLPSSTTRQVDGNNSVIDWLNFDTYNINGTSFRASATSSGRTGILQQTMDSLTISYSQNNKLRYNLGKDSLVIKGNMGISASSADSVLVRGSDNVVVLRAQSDLGGGLLSGTYTPTLTNVANVAASTAYSCQYSRVGTVVTVSGEVDIDPTTTLTLTQLGISLPIASNLTATNELGGTSADDLGTVARVAGDATNNRAEIRMTPVDVTNRRFSFTFTYRIL